MYLGVFDNSSWVPVAWSAISINRAHFEKLGKSVVYQPLIYDNGLLTPFSDPFLISQEGKFLNLSPKFVHEKTPVDLFRKYPVLDWWDSRTLDLIGGKFQGSNDPTFHYAETLYTIKEKSDLSPRTVIVSSSHKFKFMRFIGADSSYSEMAEISFYDTADAEIKGKVISSLRGNDTISAEFAFDKKDLTFFHGNKTDSNWVGLETNKEMRIKKIAFLPRNDENFIEADDEYQLSYDKGGQWISIGKLKGNINHRLHFENVPTNALFLLSDLSKGKEERIFTIEAGKQVWW